MAETAVGGQKLTWKTMTEQCVRPVAYKRCTKTAQACGAVEHAAIFKPVTHYPRTLWGATQLPEIFDNSVFRLEWSGRYHWTGILI
jgi:hypothetical protein